VGVYRIAHERSYGRIADHSSTLALLRLLLVDEALQHWRCYAVAFMLIGIAAADTALSACRLGTMTYSICCSPRATGHGQGLSRAIMNSRGERQSREPSFANRCTGGIQALVFGLAFTKLSRGRVRAGLFFVVV
jgi:hypothetical protein